MNGAQIIIKTAVKAGIKICFANPGTTEMPLVAALDSVPGIQAKLGLFEGCCTGAADGYGRLTGTPALTLLHLGPGLANGIANLHNAHRAGTPMVNIIGDHASWHRPADAPLTMDIETLAGVIPGWQRTSTAVDRLSQDMADAISAAMAGQVATLIVPQDVQWDNCSDPTICRPSFSHDPIDDDLVKSAAAQLKPGQKTLVILGGQALRKQGLLSAARIQAKTGCDLMSDSFPAHTHIGAGLPVLKRVPYFPEHAVQKLVHYHTVIRIGTKPIVSFFGYKDVNCQLLSKEQTVINLTPCRQDLQQTLNRLADHAGVALVKDMDAASTEIPEKADLPQGKLTGGTICQVLSAMVPENSIVVEEAITSGTAYSTIAAAARPHSLLTLTGGALGQGMPCSVGAAFACPDRTVISFNGDGAAMYTLQSLWMEARDNLNITTLICANRSYDILKLEYHRAGNTDPAQNTAAMMSLDNPSIDWVKMSEGMGVPAESVTSAAQLARALKTAMASPGPHLIEMVM